MADAPTNGLGVNRWIWTGGPNFTTKLPPGGGKGPQLSFSIAQTRGCSCAQIIEKLGLGEGHKKFGCSISAMQDYIASLPPAPTFTVHLSEPVGTLIPPDGPTCDPPAVTDGSGG